jgi:hypothetical protein
LRYVALRCIDRFLRKQTSKPGEDDVWFHFSELLDKTADKAIMTGDEIECTIEHDAQRGKSQAHRLVILPKGTIPMFAMHSPHRVTGVMIEDIPPRDFRSKTLVRTRTRFTHTHAC